MSSNRRLTFATATLLAAVGVFLVVRNLSSPPAADGLEKASEIVYPRIRKVSEQPAPAVGNPGIESGEGLAEVMAPENPQAKQTVLEEIEEASISYDPKGLPVIQRYLLSADPEVREAARNGMIVLGDKAASPMLRDAAKLAPTSQDTIELLQAAEYLELPSAKITVKPLGGGEKKKK